MTKLRWIPLLFSIGVLAGAVGCGSSAAVAEKPAAPPAETDIGAEVQAPSPAADEPVPPPPFKAQCPMDYLMEINAEIERHVEEVRTCYSKRMADREQTFGGAVDLKIGISAEGDVDSVDVVENTIEDPPLLECVLEMIRGLSFHPSPCGKLVIMKKLTFKAKVLDKP